MIKNHTNMDYFRDLAKNEFVTEGPPANTENLLSVEYLDRMKNLSEDFQNIKWLPLDIPRIDLDDTEEFFSIWNSQSIDIVRRETCVAEPWSKEDHPLGVNSSWYVPQFKGLTLWSHPANNLDNNPFVAKKYEGTSKQIERIVDQVFEYFPIQTFWEIFLWESLIPIGPHRDKSAYWKCPTEFRSMIYDENSDPTLYVVDVEHGDKNYIDCPSDTNSFCWSNGSQIHGSDYFGKRKVILCMNGIQHSKKCRDLFTKSISKYKSKLNYNLEI